MNTTTASDNREMITADLDSLALDAEKLREDCENRDERDELSEAISHIELASRLIKALRLN